MRPARPSSRALVRLISSRPPDLRDGSLACVFVARDEMLRLPDFLRHYREMGVTHFLAVDDRSKDGSREWLLGQPDVSVFGGDCGYAESNFGVLWWHELLNEYLDGRWVVVVDTDELLVYPHEDRSDLRGLCRWLQSCGAECAVATMVDMYPPNLASVSGFRPGDSMLAACPLFDRDGYQWYLRRAFPRRYLRGGARARLFYDSAVPSWARLYMTTYHRLEPFGLQRVLPRANVTPWEPPFLTKVPVVRWRRGLEFRASTHWLKPTLKESALTTALLHFKYLSDFAAKVTQAVAENNHWHDSVEYRRCAARLAVDPDLSFVGPSTTRYGGPADLIEAGLLRDSPEFAAWSASQRDKATTRRATSATTKAAFRCGGMRIG